MPDDTYKKTYRGLIIWIAALFSTIVLVPLLSRVITDGDVLTKLFLMIVLAMLDILMFVIYRGEYVYWINGGPDYETAQKAPPEQRKRYAFRHLKVFLIASIIAAVYMAFSFALHIAVGFDIAVFAVTVIAAAFSTMRIKF